MNRNRLFASAAALVLLTGCGPEVRYVQSDPTVLSPKPRGYDMPFSYEPADRPHLVLGEAWVSSSIKPNFSETSTMDQVLNEMKKRALKAGADAIVDLRALDSQAGGRHGKLTMTGKFIIYTAPPALSRAGE